MKFILRPLGLVAIGCAAVVAGIVAAFRYVTQSGDDMHVSEATRLRLNAEADDADRVRELDDARVTEPRTVLDGPVSRYDVEVKR